MIKEETNKYNKKMNKKNSSQKLRLKDESSFDGNSSLESSEAENDIHEGESQLASSSSHMTEDEKHRHLQHRPVTSNHSLTSSTNLPTSTSTPGTANTSHSNTLHFTDQVKSVMQKNSSALDVKVNFKTKAALTYGMTFLIMNYNKEVLYVHRLSKENEPAFYELRLKPLNKVGPHDRIKFKALDLVNPSNPKTIRYGDPLWIQAVIDEENTNIMSGFVLTSKLIEPPNLQSIALETHSFALQAHSSNNNNNNSSATSSTSTSTTTTTANHAPQTTAPSTSTSTPAPTEDDEDKIAKICGYIHCNRIAESRHDGYQPPADSVGALKNSMRYNTKQTMILGKWAVNSALRPDQLQSHHQHHHYHHHPSNNNHNHNNGGGANSNGNNNNDSKNDKNSRGNGGSQEKSGGGTSGTGNSSSGGAGGGSDNNNNAPMATYNTGDAILSLSPIVIQQDCYCLSTSNQLESKQSWPPNSFDILYESSNQTNFHLNKEVVRDLNERYMKHLEHMRKTGSLPHRLEPMITKEKATNLSHAYYAMMNNNINSTGGANQHTNNNNGSSKGFSLANAMNSSLHHANATSAPPAATDLHGCLRKIVRRTAPYDFNVDRRCVWQFCLFEEFSDNFLELSSKEKHAKRVMETASMALKISKMNREGANVHIPLNEQEQLPALISGEQFSKRIREITFRTNRRAEEEYLMARRVREFKLGIYFASKIPEVLEREKVGFRSITNSGASLFSARDESYHDLLVMQKQEDEAAKGAKRRQRKRRRQKKRLELQQAMMKGTSSSKLSLSSMDTFSWDSDIDDDDDDDEDDDENSDGSGSYSGSGSGSGSNSDNGSQESDAGNQQPSKKDGLQKDQNPRKPVVGNRTTASRGGAGGGIVIVSNSKRSNKLEESKSSPRKNIPPSPSSPTPTAILPPEIEDVNHPPGHYRKSLVVMTANHASIYHAESTDHSSVGKAGKSRQASLVSGIGGKSRQGSVSPSRHSSAINTSSTTATATESDSVSRNANRKILNAIADAQSNVLAADANTIVNTPSTNDQSNSHHHHSHHHSHHHGHHHHHHHHHGHHPQLSEEIQKVFHTKVKAASHEQLVLTNHDRIKHFDRLSAGEQVMAWHRTLNHYNRQSEKQFLQQLQMEKEKDQMIKMMKSLRHNNSNNNTGKNNSGDEGNSPLMNNTGNSLDGTMPPRSNRNRSASMLSINSHSSNNSSGHNKMSHFSKPNSLRSQSNMHSNSNNSVGSNNSNSIGNGNSTPNSANGGLRGGLHSMSLSGLNSNNSSSNSNMLNHPTHSTSHSHYQQQYHHRNTSINQTADNATTANNSNTSIPSHGKLRFIGYISYL
jgi:hypothetical protein